MKLVTVMAAGLLAVVAQTEDARARVLLPESRELTHVSPTEMLDAAQHPLTLCHMTRKSHLLGLGVWRSSIGYVLSRDGCRSTSSTSVLNPEEILSMRQAGLLPARVTLVPQLSRMDRLTGFLLPFLALASAGAGAWVRLRGRSANGSSHSEEGAERQPQDAMSQSGFQSRLVDVMCQAACAKEQRLSPAKCHAIARIATALTETPVVPERITRKYGLAIRRVPLDHLRRFGDGMSRAQRRVLLSGALLVTEFRGTRREAEIQFVLTLGTALGLGPEEVQTCRATAAEVAARIGPLLPESAVPPLVPPIPVHPVRRALHRPAEQTAALTRPAASAPV
ncbi:MAG: hypothetical protein ABNH26_08095 [Celeribacter sp.]|jgi:hypothetical protein